LRTTFALLVTLLCTTLLSACSGTRPASLGTPNASLELCPDSPNCVSSIDSKEDKEHFIQAIQFTDKATAHKALMRLIKDNPSAAIITSTQDYIYAEYTSDLMRFVDDVEFLFDDNLNVIHVRSASRIGRSDFGVNRERIETLRTQLKSGKE